MIKLTLILFILTTVHFATLGQVEYNITIEDRNMAIDLTNEAIINIKEKKADDAIDKLIKAISIDSTYRDTYLQLFQAGILKISNSGRVMKELQKGKRIFQEDDELNFYCGELYRLNSDYKNAILEYSNAITFAKTNGEDFYLVPYYYLNRGNCYQKETQLNKALGDYNYLIKLKPDLLSALTNRGVCLYKLGKKDEACKDWNTAMGKGYSPAKEYYNKHCNK